jgi:hypothetical protein
LGWLSERQLLDAVAVGQVTPGPLFGGVSRLRSGRSAGAVLGTVAIFLPAFVLGRDQRTAGPAIAVFEHRGRCARWNQRRGARPDDRGFGAAGPQRNRRLVHARAGGAGRAVAVALSSELRMACAGGRGGWQFDAVVVYVRTATAREAQSGRTSSITPSGFSVTPASNPHPRK